MNSVLLKTTAEKIIIFPEVFRQIQGLLGIQKIDGQPLSALN
jgi:hypothetical protein